MRRRTSGIRGLFNLGVVDKEASHGLGVDRSADASSSRTSPPDAAAAAAGRKTARAGSGSRMPSHNLSPRA